MVENECLDCPCYYYCSLESCINDVEPDDEFDLEELIEVRKYW